MTGYRVAGQCAAVHGVVKARAGRPAYGRAVPGSTTASSAWPVWATKARPTCYASRSRRPAQGELTVDQQAYNAVHGALRCLGERANSLLKTTSAPRGAVLYPPCSGERLKEVSLDPMALPELERERGP